MFVVPGFVIWITPPYAQMAFELWFNAGVFPTRTVGDPGDHGAGITGMHGIGVKTPNAAAVAAATAGFAMD